MNNCEKEMIDTLKFLRDEYGALSVKAEFEAEGTRTDELLRLIDLARQAKLKVSLKIGGCEAVRDLIESKQFGVEYIVAPMIETPYALTKFIQAKNKVYSPEQQKYTEFLFNLETITAFNAIHELVRIANLASGVQGIVFGRVDFAGSLSLGRDAIDTETITNYAIEAAKVARKQGLDMVIGGGVGISSLPELKRVAEVHLSRFETRKVVFGGEALSNGVIAKGLEKTVYFELLWLKNKRDYYSDIQGEDANRIAMLQERWMLLSANS